MPIVVIRTIKIDIYIGNIINVNVLTELDTPDKGYIYEWVKY